MKRITTIVCAILFSLLAVPAFAQGPGGHHRGPGMGPGGPHGGPGMGPGGPHGPFGGPGPDLRDELMDALYPPQMVRHHAGELKLTADQEKKLKAAIFATRAQADELAWNMETESRKLAELAKQGTRDQILAQLDKVLAIETKIKRSHLDLMLQIRDLLTADQRKILDKIKETKRAAGGPPPGGPGYGPPPPR